MYQFSLRFGSINDLCLFINEMNLRNFLLLGKKKILIARFSDRVVARAKQAYKAEPVPVEEVEQVATLYFAGLNG